MGEIGEMLTALAFFIGAFKSTPEGRARRALKVKQRAERKLHRLTEKWRRKRLKYVKELRREWSNKEITREDYNSFLADYDRDYKQPK